MTIRPDIAALRRRNRALATTWLILYGDDYKPLGICQLVYVEAIDVPVPDIAEKPLMEMPVIADNEPDELQSLVHLSALAVFTEELFLELQPLFRDLVPLRSYGHFERYLAPAVLDAQPRNQWVEYRRANLFS